MTHSDVQALFEYSIRVKQSKDSIVSGVHNLSCLCASLTAVSEDVAIHLIPVTLKQLGCHLHQLLQGLYLHKVKSHVPVGLVHVEYTESCLQ